MENEKDDKVEDSLAKQLAAKTLALENEKDDKVGGSLAKQLADIKDDKVVGSLAKQLKDIKDDTVDGSLADRLNKMTIKNSGNKTLADAYKEELILERTASTVNLADWKKIKPDGSPYNADLTAGSGANVGSLAKQLSAEKSKSSGLQKNIDDAVSEKSQSDSAAVETAKKAQGTAEKALKEEQAAHKKTKEDYLKDLKSIDDKITALLSIGSKTAAAREKKE